MTIATDNGVIGPLSTRFATSRTAANGTAKLGQLLAVTGGLTILAPVVSSLTPIGTQFAVGDDASTAAASPITVDGNTKNIDGAAIFSIATNDQIAVFVWDGTQWKRAVWTRALPASGDYGYVSEADQLAGAALSANATSFRGTPLQAGALALGETYIKRGATFVGGKPVPGRFNVLDYGAIGNNIADDTAAITAAIAAAQAAGSGIVFFPPGKYKVTSPLPDLALETNTTAIWLEGAMTTGIDGDNNGGVGASIHSYINTAPNAGRSSYVVSIGHMTDANWTTHNGVKNLTFYSEVDQFFLMAGVSAASDGAALPQATINVTSTAGWPASGTFTVQTNFGAQRVRYSGKTNTSFTGCTSTAEQGLGTIGGTTIAAGSNGASLPRATVFVASSANFNAAGGTVLIATASGPQRMTYTGKGAGTLTGCSGGVGAMATGGVVGSLLASLDDLKANGTAAIEATGATDFVIQNCAFINFPIGILLDGAESVHMRRIFCGSDGHGYKPNNTDSIGIWAIGTSTRPGGFPSGGATNDIHIDGFVGGGGTGVWFEGGVAHSIRHANFEGGVRAVHIGGVNGAIVDQCLCEGYSSECVFADGCLNGIISNSILGGAGSPLGAVPAIRFGFSASSQMALTNNQVGGSVVRGGAAIINAGLATNHMYGVGNILSAADGVTLFDTPFAGGAAFTFNIDEGPATGVGSNLLKSATAVFDGYMINGQKRFFRIAAGTPSFSSDLYEHNLVTPQSQSIKRSSVSADIGLQGTASGTLTITDNVLQAAAGANKNACAYAIPDGTSVLVEFRVIQRKYGDATGYAVWRCSTIATRSGGVIAFDAGGLTDDAAPRTSAAGFVHPTLIDDGSGNIVVVVKPRADVQAFAQVRADFTIISTG